MNVEPLVFLKKLIAEHMRACVEHSVLLSKWLSNHWFSWRNWLPKIYFCPKQKGAGDKSNDLAGQPWEHGPCKLASIACGGHGWPKKAIPLDWFWLFRDGDACNHHTTWWPRCGRPKFWGCQDLPTIFWGSHQDRHAIAMSRGDMRKMRHISTDLRCPSSGHVCIRIL